MNSTTSHLLWSVGRARWFLVALHVPFMLSPIVLAVGGIDGRRGNPLVAVPIGLALGALQLRHSFAAARGERPRGWPWTLLAVVLLVYLPFPWLGWDWLIAQWAVIASAPMLLPRRFGIAVATLPIVGSTIASSWNAATVYSPGVWAAIFQLVYLPVVLAFGGLGLYAAARLVKVVAALHSARSELAELAVGRERLRLSRDLHDLLGHSLSAVALKGDLAGRLLHSDPSAARSEITGLAGAARDALRDLRAVTRDEHAVSLRSETDGAAALLAAAGIDATIEVDLPDLNPTADSVLAWAVREGVTNILRHSEAGACSILAARRDGVVRLRIVNDGVRRTPDRAGTGLAGLSERARAISGTVSAGDRDGNYVLQVEVPQDQ